MGNHGNHNDWREAGSYASKGSAQSYLNAYQAAGSKNSGSACGAGEPKPAPSACGAGEPKPAPSACGAGEPKPKPSACGAGGK